MPDGYNPSSVHKQNQKKERIFSAIILIGIYKKRLLEKPETASSLIFHT